MNILPERVRILNNSKINVEGSIVYYWMSRDQRVNDNWALLFAQQKALETNSRLEVLFIYYGLKNHIHPRNIKFMLEGLRLVANSLNVLNIPFNFISGDSLLEITRVANKKDTTCIVSDFSPLKNRRKKVNKILSKINVPFYEVDTHNIVPCWLASNKQEFAARTFRPKITSVLEKYLTEFPKPQKQKYKKNIKKTNWEYYIKEIENKNIKYPIRIKPGEQEANKKLQDFISYKLQNYNENKNDPTKDVLSGLSAYLHFGQISSQRVVLEINKKEKDLNVQSFIEEIVVRKELSDNYCYYNENYNNINGVPAWARKELDLHIQDKRDYVYSLNDFEKSNTHDPLWNAANMEMIILGKMHGYLRMYWAKKILEWTQNPKDAIDIAIYLNDKYELDGRDPNGYVGILWSVGGLHDRPFFKRPIIGKIRPMTRNGLEKKFDVNSYLFYISNLRKNTIQVKTK